ncbi:MAG: threonine synthase [Bosea sp. (in: a-proteobacteria)]
MRHISTRGEAPALSFNEALLAGLARDGGLYVPEAWPVLGPDEITGFSGRPYQDVAKRVLGLLSAGDIPDDELSTIIDTAYAAFAHKAVCPLVQIAPGLFVLELFHGPTLAFKDVAMRFLAGAMDRELKRKGQRATIVGATSGDTGSAAIDAFRGSEQVDVFILYPHGRVSEVQRRQMTTPTEDNVHAIAIDGTFDDCQALVKGMFNHHAFRDGLALSGVNSINWARIVAQSVYYFTAAVSLGAPARKVAFTVPSGNFGNVLAGDVARRMGLPLGQLTIATNANDILTRIFKSGGAELTSVMPTHSPSMDIQVSSNFERTLFEALGRDAGSLRAIMANVAQSGSYRLPQSAMAQLNAVYAAGRCGEDETLATMARVHATTGYVLDPHTAVGVHVAEKRQTLDPAVPMVVLGTAHPAKFPDAVEKAIGKRPALPEHLADLLERPERLTRLPNDQGEIERFIAGRSRAAKGHAAKGHVA